MKQTLLFIAIIVSHLSVIAQSKSAASTEMNVDLPDETEEASLVNKGSIQLETALLLNRYRQEASSAIGQALLRIGVSDRVELRALLEEGKNRDTYFDQTVQSTMPLGIGSKISLVKDHSWLPDMTFIGQLCLPLTSKSSGQREHWSPLLLMAFENKLSPKWKLEYNAGGQQEIFSTQWVWLANGSLHYHISDPLEVFLEYYAQYGVGKSGHNNVGGGLTYQLGNNIQVYLSAGSSVGYHEPNQFAAGGIAFRLP
ncbi:transporter [Niabella sp. 22666]|uniref:transporter n=1 Tax=Niabella sp. 22666 TaxID=3453954 RepID=UPI003F857200